jgi:hypothetical protein
MQSVNNFVIYTYTKGMFKTIYMHNTSLNQCWWLNEIWPSHQPGYESGRKKIKIKFFTKFFSKKNLPKDYKKIQ